MIIQLKLSSVLQADMKILLQEKLSWNGSIHAVMFCGKKIIPDNRLQSVCLIPTDTHLFHKETSLWNQWDFRATHQREYENQVGANFHFGVKYLYQIIKQSICSHLLALIDNLKQ